MKINNDFRVEQPWYRSTMRPRRKYKLTDEEHAEICKLNSKNFMWKKGRFEPRKEVKNEL